MFFNWQTFEIFSNGKVTKCSSTDKLLKCFSNGKVTKCSSTDKVSSCYSTDKVSECSSTDNFLKDFSTDKLFKLFFDWQSVESQNDISTAVVKAYPVFYGVYTKEKENN